MDGELFVHSYDPVTGFPLWFPEEFRYRRKISAQDFAEQKPGCCRWCGNPVEKGRRTACKECAKRVQLWCGISVLYEVFNRDKGLCSECGIDVQVIEHWFDLLIRRRPYNMCVREVTDQFGPLYRYGSCWDADHIIPVSEGGGCCDLRNYRTLCVACHKKETAALAKRRGKSGKINQEQCTGV